MNISPISVHRIGVSSYPTPQDERAIYRIKGKVKELGVDIPATVQLYLKRTSQLVASIETDVLGRYEFNGLLKTKFFIVAHHPKNQFNAVIQDNVVPK